MFARRHPGETTHTKSFNKIKLKELNMKLFNTGLSVSPFRPVYSVTFIPQRMQQLYVEYIQEIRSICFLWAQKQNCV